MKNNNLKKVFLALGLGLGLSSMANATDGPSAEQCDRFWDLCASGGERACAIYKNQCN